MADTTEIKVDIESLRKDIENVNTINGRIDTAIDRLTDVSTSIKSMLAVHEEKITRQEKLLDILRTLDWKTQSLLSVKVEDNEFLEKVKSMYMLSLLENLLILGT